MRTGVNTALAVSGELAKHNLIRQNLLSEIPDLDEETLTDTLDGATDLREILVRVVRSSLDDQALVEALTTRIADMRARQDRIETRSLRKRQIVLNAMTSGAISKLFAEDFSASVRLGSPTLEISDEHKIPAAYWRPQPAKLDRQGLIVALKSGTSIEGAVLTPPQSQLSVRVK